MEAGFYRINGRICFLKGRKMSCCSRKNGDMGDHGVFVVVVDTVGVLLFGMCYHFTPNR